MMAGWDEILKEVQETPSQMDLVRRKYLKELSNYTGRNVISYYSAFLTKMNDAMSNVNDADINGFMNSLKGMDCKKGLDWILHTPGGSPVAAEAIVKYLRKKFNNDIRIIVPQLAMSAGTMMACSGKSIVMGKSSSLGPIDPQFNGIPTYSILKEFKDAKEDLAKNPKNMAYWSIQLQKYPAAFVKTANDAIQLSGELIENWLGTCMFDAHKDNETIKNIVSVLNDHDNSKEHGRHFDIDFCKKIGLKIEDLESDSKLQDAVLSVHHAYMITLNNSTAVKIIESQNDKTWIMNSN